MPKIVTPFFTLMIVASLWPAVALSADERGTLDQAPCAHTAYMDQNTAPAKNALQPCEPATDAHTGAHKIENVPLATVAGAAIESGPDRPQPSAGIAEALPEGRRAVRRDMPNANARVQNGHNDEWVRLSEGPIPEPGAWAVLLAGILGVLAVARPRVFSS
ncbi:MAG: hypothetical protein ABI619_09765 [Betaproteobacteria bacterium]